MSGRINQGLPTNEAVEARKATLPFAGSLLLSFIYINLGQALALHDLFSNRRGNDAP